MNIKLVFALAIILPISLHADPSLVANEEDLSLIHI